MSNQLQITGGGKVRNLEGVITGTSGVLSSVPLGAANGVATLDSGGKVPVSQLPSSVVTYLGTWNAATNTPTLVNGTGDAGDMYICNVAGTVNFGAGPVVFVVGDWVLYGSGTWQKSSGQNGTVTSVGLSTNGNSITIGSSPITTSGTITANFNGTNLQYVNGAGNLTTFPILTGYVPYTGATQAVNLGAYDLTVNELTVGKGTSGLSNNTALGHQALFHITTGNYNTGVGHESLHNTSTGQYNTAIGQSSLFTNTTGSQNTALGLNALLSNTSGSSNVVVGLDGMQHNTTGGSNTALGYNAGSHITGGTTPNTTASNSIYIGRDTRANVDGGANEIVIGSAVTGSGSNTVTIGNSSITANYFKGSINGGSFVKTGGTSSQFLKADGTVDSSTYALDSAVVHNTGNETIGGTKTFSDATKNNGGIFLQNASSSSLAGYMNIGGLTNGVKFTSGGGISNTFTLPSATGYTFTFDAITGSIAMLEGTQTFTGAKTFDAAYFNGAEFINTAYFDKGLWLVKNGIPSVFTALQTTIYSESTSNNVIFRDNVSKAKLIFNNSTQTFTFPNATGTIALTSDLTGGTVTSVAALTIGTTGTDLSSTVANSTTTPVITLNVPTASATNRGALSSADWTTFNNKQSALTNPVTGTGTTNYLPKFTGASTIGNSAITEDGTTVTLVSRALSGTSATFNGNLTNTSSNFQTYGSTSFGASTWGLSIGNGGASANYYRANDHYFQNGAGTQTLQLSSTGAATFSSSVTAGQGYFTHTDTPVKFNNSGGTITQVDFLNNGTQKAAIWWNNSTNTLNLYTGVTALTITSTGNVGIGTTTPDRKLQVNGDVTLSGNNYIQYDKILQWEGYSYWTLRTQTTGADFQLNNGSAGVAAFTIKGNNNFLIGTTTDAGYKLDVNGTSRFSGNMNINKTGSSSILFLSNGDISSINGTDAAFLEPQNGGKTSYFGRENSTGSWVFTTAVTPYSTVIAAYNTTAPIILGHNNAEVTIANGGATTFSSSVTATSESFITGGDGAGKMLKFTGGTTKYNFMIAVQQNVNNALEITPSTAAGGSTFTTPALTIASTGAATFSSSVTATSFFESSDSRLKTLIHDNYQTKGIASITPKLYTKNGKIELGYYAQDFVGVLDSAVSKGSDDMLSLSYREVLVAKVYALEQEIKKLKAKLN